MKCCDDLMVVFLWPLTQLSRLGEHNNNNNFICLTLSDKIKIRLQSVWRSRKSQTMHLNININISTLSWEHPASETYHASRHGWSIKIARKLKKIGGVSIKDILSYLKFCWDIVWIQINTESTARFIRLG